MVHVHVQYHACKIHNTDTGEASKSFVPISDSRLLGYSIILVCGVHIPQTHAMSIFHHTLLQCFFFYPFFQMTFLSFSAKSDKPFAATKLLLGLNILISTLFRVK